MFYLSRQLRRRLGDFRPLEGLPKPEGTGFIVPTEKTWSLQHSVIRNPRPLSDHLPLDKLHPHKAWWKERPVRVSEFFMGFPDVAKWEIRGGALYAEQMDAVTLAAVLERCLVKKIFNEEIWTMLCWRAQQLASQLTDTHALSLIYLAFAQAGWFDSHFVATYLGKMRRKLQFFSLSDCSIAIDAMRNIQFRHAGYLKDLLSFSLHLLRRDNFSSLEDVSKLLVALQWVDISQKKLFFDEFVKEVPLELITLAKVSVVADIFWVFASFPEVSSSTKILRVCLKALESRINEAEDENAGGNTHFPIFLKILEAGNHLSEDLFFENFFLFQDIAKRLSKGAYKLTGSLACSFIFNFLKLREMGLPRSLWCFEILVERVLLDKGTLNVDDIAKAFFGSCLKPELSSKLLKDFLVPNIRENIKKQSISALLLIFDGISRTKKIDEVEGIQEITEMVLRELFMQRENFSLDQACYILESLAYLHPEDSSIIHFFHSKISSNLDNLSFSNVSRVFREISTEDEEVFQKLGSLQLFEDLIDVWLKKEKRENHHFDFFFSLVGCLKRCPRDFILKKLPQLREAFARCLSHTHFPSISATKISTLLIDLTEISLFDEGEESFLLMKKMEYFLEMKRFELSKKMLEDIRKAFKASNYSPRYMNFAPERNASTSSSLRRAIA